MFKPIQSGSTIGVIAPAWIASRPRLEQGKTYLKKRGFLVKEGKCLNKKRGYFAGTEAERVEDIHMMFSDPEISMILCTRGGWGSLRLLDRLDFDLIGNNPKPLVGYSDVTTLQLAIWAKCGLPSFSGPMLAVEMADGIDAFTEKHFWGLVQNRRPEYSYRFEKSSGTVLKKGKASGTLLGGCLSLVSHLLGTSYTPDYSGSVLFLEDVGEKPYKIDRYLAHLKQAGIFDQINALILGEFIDCEDKQNDKSFSLNDILLDYFSNAPFPVLMNFPYGHGKVKITMPVGVTAQIDTSKKMIKFANPFLP